MDHPALAASARSETSAMMTIALLLCVATCSANELRLIGAESEGH